MYSTMSILKAQWNTEGENVRLSMPFSKVDKERRIVSGFASLDNLDRQMDIVTTEASMKAFENFRGNIREMHQPLAVGKMVSFKQDKYFDSESKKFYNGVFVSAYVSKGAQSTWEKVLDGTLTGFSIGGRMNKWDDAFDEKLDSQIRIIKDYDLVELSLVDSPANEFANIMSVEKVDGVSIIKGDNTTLENVFWDSETGIVMVSENEKEISPTTGNEMKNIGFVEKTDNEKINMIKFLVDSAKGINTSKITKEVSPMTETTEVVAEIVEKSDIAVENVEVAPEADAVVDAPAAEVVAVDAPAAEAVVDAEKADTVEAVAEVTEEVATEVSKADDVIVEAVTEVKNTLTSAFSDLLATVKSLQTEVADLNKQVADTKSQIVNTQNALVETNGAVNEFGKRMESVESDTAFRKSGDLGEVVQLQPVMVEKSLWGGRFLKTADLFR
ncbi:Phage-like element PBSX protein, XkdF [uncultured Caudovirales phage]|uniref:Phage-like element PBSX protein, XkdF n=1 Tax=uncultured Caudovirales phage TaxID=2100421 RepID=A0A6J5P3A2_9CAUD|nr:Phage-like element PBSX protein, XkdF [uncultured Caudovirales phage]